MENGSAIVISYANRYFGFANEKGDNVVKTSAACHVYETLPKAIAAFKGSSAFMKLSKLRDILVSDGVDDVRIICAKLFLSVFREESLNFEGVLNLNSHSAVLVYLHQVFLRAGVGLILPHHSNRKRRLNFGNLDNM